MPSISLPHKSPVEPVMEPLDWTGDEFDQVGPNEQITEDGGDITRRFPFELRRDIVSLADFALASPTYMESIKQFPREAEIETIIRRMYQQEIFDKGEYQPLAEALEIVVRWLVKPSTRELLVERMAKRSSMTFPKPVFVEAIKL